MEEKRCSWMYIEQSLNTMSTSSSKCNDFYMLYMYIVAFFCYPIIVATRCCVNGFHNSPVSFARLIQFASARSIPLHFPAVFITSPVSFNVIEQLRYAHTALISPPLLDDNTFDLESDDTHGLDVRPNCPSPPLPNVMTSFLLEDSITV